MVQRRNEALVKKAAQSSEIVSSLFPGHLRQRILEETHVNKAISPNDLKTYLHDRKDTNGQEQSTRPIADLYLNTTVMVRAKRVHSELRYGPFLNRVLFFLEL